MRSPHVGYCVTPNPRLASYRLRVELIRPHLGLPSCIGPGDVEFRYKDASGGGVYDVVNDHFPSYAGACLAAHTVTCSSAHMAEVVRKETGRQAVVIPDPYENELSPPEVMGRGVLWFGHGANLSTLAPVEHLTVCTGEGWSLQSERECLEDCALVYLTGKPTASANRVIKALRAGRFVVTPGRVPSWDELAEFIWIGDVQQGIAWALNNREEACSKIRAGQQYSERFSPSALGRQWGDLFASILGLDTSAKRDGLL